MKFPIEWLSEYCEIKNTPEQIGEMFTYLEFMQDGPINNGVIDLEIRQNRPDALSIIGLAIEYSAKSNSKFKVPEITKLDFSKPDKLLNPQIDNQIKRFIAVKIEDIKVTQSPAYMIKRLNESGIRSVNNIVDITNYVMLEYGIPMHVFDADKLGKDCKLTLRLGKQGEKLETWLGDKINLNTSDIVIANINDEPASLGGITGEKNSGATTDTVNIILESANYEQSLIRQSALKHNLLTDSANRHTKFLPSEMVEVAIKRSCYLINKLCGGQVTLAEDYYPEKQKQSAIHFNLKNINRLGGIDIETSKVLEILANLHYEIISKNEIELVVKSPIQRTDVIQEVDVLEDILRVYGYENIPQQQIKLAPPEDRTPEIYIFEDRVKDLLVQLGMEEHITEPLVKDDRNPTRVVLENSLNSDKNSLRVSIEETLTLVLINYIKHKHKQVKIFEVGKIYAKTNKTYSEISTVGAIIYTIDCYKTAKGILDTFFASFGVNNYYLQLTEDQKLLKIMCGNNKVGFVKYSLRDSIYFEINLQELINLVKDTTSSITTKIPFEHEQILNLVVNKNTLFTEIEKLINSINTKDRSTKITTKFIEEYSDEILRQINKKSYLLSLKIQNLISPVSKEEFKPLKEAILNQLKSKLDIDLKES